MLPDWPRWVRRRASRLATWTDVVGCSTSGNSITKTAGTGAFDSGGATVQTLTGNGYVQFTTGETNKDKMGGLAHIDPAQNFMAIDYAIYLAGDGSVNIYESGVNIGAFGAYLAADVFKIQVAGSTVTYLHGGIVFHTSLNAPTLPLLFGTSMFGPGSTINGVIFVP